MNGRAAKHACSILLATMLAIGPVSAQQSNPEAQKTQSKAPVLQGNIRKSIYNEPSRPLNSEKASFQSGYVTQAKTHQAMAGVTVQVPDLNFTTTTGKDGHFQLPKLPNKPTIVAFAKQGYVPQTVTVNQNSNSPLAVSLREIRQTLVLDNQIRHLGDNSYSPVSAGAGEFRRETEGVALVRHFNLNHPIQETAFLEIGSVIGLDTETAHQMGQSAFHRISTPMIVRLNGQVLTHIAANGDGLRIPITPHQINPTGTNRLEIITGYQTPDGAYVDYDDIELMLLTLDY